MIKLNERVISYFEEMIYDFNCGNDNEYESGVVLSFIYEDIEKGDRDIYDDSDVDNFIYVREFILSEGGEVKYKSEGIEYKFEVIKNDIKCSWIE
jgi:hypothetical protein